MRRQIYELNYFEEKLLWLDGIANISFLTVLTHENGKFIYPPLYSFGNSIQTGYECTKGLWYACARLCLYPM